MMNDMKKLLLEAPDDHIAKAVVDVIRRWTDPEETAIQVLEALDTAVHCGGASDFGMKVLNILYHSALNREETTHEEVVKNATWRTQSPSA